MNSTACTRFVLYYKCPSWGRGLSWGCYRQVAGNILSSDILLSAATRCMKLRRVWWISAAPLEIEYSFFTCYWLIAPSSSDWKTTEDVYEQRPRVELFRAWGNRKPKFGFISINVFHWYRRVHTPGYHLQTQRWRSQSALWMQREEGKEPCTVHCCWWHEELCPLHGSCSAWIWNPENEQIAQHMSNNNNNIESPAGINFPSSNVSQHWR